MVIIQQICDKKCLHIHKPVQVIHKIISEKSTDQITWKENTYGNINKTKIKFDRYEKVCES